MLLSSVVNVVVDGTFVGVLVCILSVFVDASTVVLGTRVLVDVDSVVCIANSLIVLK